MKKSNQQKSPGCLYILFNVFVVMPFLVFLIFFVFALLLQICSKVHPAVLALILIAIVAAAGYILYKKHEKKKQTEQNHTETVLQRMVTYPEPVIREPRQAPQPPDGLYEQDHLAKLAADQDARRSADAHYQAVVIDFETTGLNCDADEILQVSIIDQDENVLMNQYCRAVRHNSWESASNVNGISPPRVAFCPPFEKVAPYVQDILCRADKVLAYNCSFEQGFLSSNGINPYVLFWCDPMKEIVDYCNATSGGHRSRMALQSAARIIGYDYNAHDALEDVKATLRVHNFAAKSKEAKAQEPTPTKPKSRSGHVLYPENRQADPKNPLYGKTLVITGQLPIDREQASLQAAALGAKVRIKLSPRTQILVCGQREEEWAERFGEKSSKIKKAEQMNAEGASIEFMSGEKFMHQPAGDN
mgnify:FL=1